MSDVMTTPNAGPTSGAVQSHPATPTPPGAPPVIPDTTWRPCSAVGLDGRHKPLEFVRGNGSNVNRLLAEVRLARNLPTVGCLIQGEEVEGPIRDALQAGLLASESHKRYCSLAEQHRTAARRLTVAEANLAKIQADRVLAEAKAAPGLASRLVTLSKAAKTAQEERDKAAAEVAELVPLADKARAAMSDELRALLPKLTLEQRKRLTTEMESISTSMLEAFARVANDQLTRVAQLHHTRDRYFGSFARDLSPLVDAILKEADATARAESREVSDPPSDDDAA